jgi:ketosteroid isomerase-like protein
MKTLEKTNEDQIREITQQWLKAVHACDVDAAMAHYAADVVVYDLFGTTKVTGTTAYRKNYEMWFQCCGQAAKSYEIKELEVVASDDLAFCRAAEQTWVRVTVCYRKQGGAWKIVHEHISAPLDMESQKGVFQFRG